AAVRIRRTARRARQSAGPVPGPGRSAAPRRRCPWSRFRFFPRIPVEEDERGSHSVWLFQRRVFHRAGKRPGQAQSAGKKLVPSSEYRVASAKYRVPSAKCQVPRILVAGEFLPILDKILVSKVLASLWSFLAGL